MKITPQTPSEPHRLDNGGVSLFFDDYRNESYGNVSLFLKRVRVGSVASHSWPQFSKALRQARLI